MLTFAIKPHSFLVGKQIIEVMNDGKFVATITDGDVNGSPGIRVTTANTSGRLARDMGTGGAVDHLGRPIRVIGIPMDDIR